MSHVLGEKDDTTFRCGIAVAPVTDWRYYGMWSILHGTHTSGWHHWHGHKGAGVRPGNNFYILFYRFVLHLLVSRLMFRLLSGRPGFEKGQKLVGSEQSKMKAASKP